MGFFDFIFGNSTKKREEQERLRQEEIRRQAELERIAQERRRRAEEERRKEAERQAKLKAERELATSIEPFTFKSNCHQRYENNAPQMGLQECIRTISVEKNTNGCKGYKLAPGLGCIVKVYNDDLGRPNMSDKPMKVVRKTADMVELRGFLIEAMSPFGWQEVDYADYGFVVYYKNGRVDKCVLHMYDRNTRIEYLSKASIHVEDRYTKMIKSTQFNPFNITVDERLQPTVDLPDLRDVFVRELNAMYAKIANVPNFDNKMIIDGYTFNLVESHYNNAGYVPQKTLDQILEQVYDALQRTPLKNVFATLDNFKYNCYYAYLNK